MNLSQFTSIVDGCPGIPAERREDICKSAENLSENERQVFASKLLSLHANLAAVAKRESALLREIESITKEAGRTMAKDERKRQESEENDAQGEYVSHLLDR